MFTELGSVFEAGTAPQVREAIGVAVIDHLYVFLTILGRLRFLEVPT